MGDKANPPRARQSKRPVALSSEDVAPATNKVTGRAARVSRKKAAKNPGSRKRRQLYPESVPPAMVHEVFDVSSAPPPPPKREGAPLRFLSKPPPHPPRPSHPPLDPDELDADELEADEADADPLSLVSSRVTPLLTPPPTETARPAARPPAPARGVWLLIGGAALALGLVIALREPARGDAHQPAPPRPESAQRATPVSLVGVTADPPSAPAPSVVLPTEPPPDLTSSTDPEAAPTLVEGRESAPSPAQALLAPSLEVPAVVRGGPGAPGAEVPKASDGAALAFDTAAADAAITAAFARARACRGPGDPSGEISATLTYAPSGRVTSATVSGIFAGTPVGGCVAATLRGARVPAFSGEHLSVKRTALLR